MLLILRLVFLFFDKVEISSDLRKLIIPAWKKVSSIRLLCPVINKKHEKSSAQPRVICYKQETFY